MRKVYMHLQFQHGSSVDSRLAGVAIILSNGCTAFIWKLCSYWLRRLWQRHVATAKQAPSGLLLQLFGIFYLLGSILDPVSRYTLGWDNGMIANCITAFPSVLRLASVWMYGGVGSAAGAKIDQVIWKSACGTCLIYIVVAHKAGALQCRRF